MKRVFSIALAAIMSLVGATGVSAISEEELYKFSQGGIYFYEPSSSKCSSKNGGGNVNYAGVQVWSDSELEVVEANRAIYEEAAKKYDFPWEILAVIHYHETGLRRYNPDNGQGVYQLYSYTNGGKNSNRFTPSDSISESEFKRQTLIAAEVISKMAGDLNEPANVKRLFFQYNGVADVYIEKAIQMGFSQAEAESGEGSAYVMNRYDAQRDPTSTKMSKYWPGRFVDDGVYDSTATTNGFGAYVQYEVLAGTGYCSAAGGTISETAMNISWEGVYSHAITDPKPEYEEAMKATGVWGSLGGIPEGASCDRFVATVMRYSGADPNFPLGAVSNQEDYMKAHPEMYQEIIHNNDFNALEPGDIFISYAEHIYLYVGEINGTLVQASASYNDRTGEHFEGVYFTDNYGDNGSTRYYKVFRRINY